MDRKGFIQKVKTWLDFRFAVNLEKEHEKKLEELLSYMEERANLDILKILRVETLDFEIFWIYTEPEFGIALNYTDPELSELSYLPSLGRNIVVFVYGTLRKGFGNHRYLEKAEFLGTAKTKEKYTMRVSGIPYVSKEPTSYIVGEIYKVNEIELMNIDNLEGHPNWYKRELVKVVLDTGEELEAWMYFNETGEGEIVKSGDFSKVKSYSF